MRVLHVSQPVEAGVPTVVLSLVKDQLSRGIEVHVACPPGPGLFERALAAGATVHSWPAVRSPTTSLPEETRLLQQLAGRINPDVVVLHSAKAGMAGRLALRGSRPTVYVPHAWSFEAVRGPLRTATTAWEVLAGRWTDTVVCVSADERGRGQRAGVAVAIEVIENGIDLDKWVPLEQRPTRDELGLPDRPTVVCVGRMATQKGQDLLLAAWPAVLESVPDAQLVLVGDGPTRAALEASAPAGVTFLGARSDISLLMAAADVVALPSRWEGGALGPLEAMACGRPVVGFAVDGALNTVGDTGVILEHGDIAGFSQALAGLLADPPRAAAMGRAARERVSCIGDVRTTADRWDRLLSGLTGCPDPVPESLRILPARGVLRSLAGGALRSADVVGLNGQSKINAVRAAALSALGVPVWWQGDHTATPPALGAPILTGEVTIGQLERAARRPGAGSRNGPAVSIVVTVLNEGPEIGRLVDELEPQLRAGDEIVIVDGGSTDGSIATLEPRPDLRLEIVPGAGISAGRNYGIRIARNDIIICTDAGCVPEHGFVEGFRRAFAVDPPAMVSGVYHAIPRTAMERAQAFACYPQPAEVHRPSLFVQLYTRLFGTGFDPRFAVGRCVAFTKSAWAAAGGFPENLATGEDVSFGLAVAETGDCIATTDAVVGWNQRDGLAATWRMYRGYGRASTDGGATRLLVRDSARAMAYVVAPLLLTRRRGPLLVGVGAGAYLSLPVMRAIAGHAGPAATVLLPVALAVKDLGKLAGALQGLARRRRRKS